MSNEKETGLYPEGKPKQPRWWAHAKHQELVEGFRTPDPDSSYIESAAFWNLIAMAIDGEGKEVYTTSFDGPLKPTGREAAQAFIKELGMRKVSEELAYDGKVTRTVEIGSEGAIIYAFNDIEEKNEAPEDHIESIEEARERLKEPPKGFNFQIGVCTTDKSICERLAKLVKEHDMPMVMRNKGKAFVLAETAGGIQMVSIGVGGQSLTKENYADEVCAKYDIAVEDLRAAKPSGRLIILEGEPGTGKTYLVRAFMNAVPEARFVVVPPHLTSRLSDPGLITTFIQHSRNVEHTESKSCPLVLVLEDADMCLAERMADNIGSISGVLNLTDGILGSLLDLRILATTNAKIDELDPAILRPGRLSTHIQVDRLNAQKATAIYMRVTKKSADDPEVKAFEAKAIAAAGKHKGMTLAEIYAAANATKAKTAEEVAKERRKGGGGAGFLR